MLLLLSLRKIHHLDCIRYVSALKKPLRHSPVIIRAINHRHAAPESVLNRLLLRGLHLILLKRESLTVNRDLTRFLTRQILPEVLTEISQKRTVIRVGWSRNVLSHVLAYHTGLGVTRRQIAHRCPNLFH